MKGATDFAVFKSGFQPGELEAYSDAEYASDISRDQSHGIAFKHN